jgi:hypothetical protein
MRLSAFAQQIKFCFSNCFSKFSAICKAEGKFRGVLHLQGEKKFCSRRPAICGTKKIFVRSFLHLQGGKNFCSRRPAFAGRGEFLYKEHF